MTDKINCNLWQKPDRTMMWSIVKCGLRQKRNWAIMSNSWMQSVMKTNKIMTWPIYRFGLRQNWNWTIRTYLIWCDLWWKPNKITMWPIIQVWSAPKMKLSFRDRSNQVSCVMKTRQDSNVTYLTRAVYDENDIELSRLIGSGDDNDGNQIG